MAIVTFTLTDITAAPLPAGVAPQVVFTPSKPSVTQGGNVVATEPKVYTPTATGAVTADLIPTATVADDDFYYTLQIRWLNPDGYGPTGYTHVDFLDWKIYVPVAGGQLVDFTNMPVRADAMWVGTTPPPDDLGYQFYIDISGTAPVLKGWSA